MSRFKKGLIAFAGMSLCVSGAAVANDLTVVSWGGAYTKSQVEAYHKPWMAKTGKSLVSEDYGGGIAEIKAQVDSGNVTWDVVDVELSDAIRACDEGLLEEIDHSNVKKKIAERTKAKKGGNFNLADKIRKDLLDQGIAIEDQQDKTIWKLK